MFPKVPQSSRPESSGFPNYPLTLDTPFWEPYKWRVNEPCPYGFSGTFWDVRPSTACNLISHPKKRISKWELRVIQIYIYISYMWIGILGHCLRCKKPTSLTFPFILKTCVLTFFLTDSSSAPEAPNFVADQSCTQHPCGWCWSPSMKITGSSSPVAMLKNPNKSHSIAERGNFFQYTKKQKKGYEKTNTSSVFFFECNFFSTQNQ